MKAMPSAAPTTSLAALLSKSVQPASEPQQQPQVPAQVVETVVAAPVVVQRVAVQQTLNRSDLLANTESWTWSELRDYVVSQITERFGAFPRDARKEYGIFSRYFNEYGQDGIAVAKFAFGPVCDGWWGRAPISVNRFAKGSDPYFTQPILERLADTASSTEA